MLSPASKLLTGDITLKMSCLLYGRSSVTATFLGVTEILSFKLSYSTTYALYMKHNRVISKEHYTETFYDPVTPFPLPILSCYTAERYLTPTYYHATRITECPPFIITLHCFRDNFPCPINSMYSYT
jgi:hypothetical protein